MLCRIGLWHSWAIRKSIFFILCYQTPNSQEPLLFTTPHLSLLLSDKKPDLLTWQWSFLVLEEVSLISQILTGSDSQTKRLQGQVTLMWNVLFLIEQKEGKLETRIEVPDLWIPSGIGRASYLTSLILIFSIKKHKNGNGHYHAWL